MTLWIFIVDKKANTQRIYSTNKHAEMNKQRARKKKLQRRKERNWNIKLKLMWTRFLFLHTLETVWNNKRHCAVSEVMEILKSILRILFRSINPVLFVVVVFYAYKKKTNRSFSLLNLPFKLWNLVNVETKEQQGKGNFM